MVKLDQHDFTLATLTEFGVVTPLDFDVRHVDNGIKATSRACALYGDSRRPYSGRMDLWVERTEGGAMRWRCTAEMVHPIKGVKITVDPVPGTSVVEAAGNPVDLGDGQGHTTVFPSSWYLATRIPQSGIRRVGTNFAQHLYIHGNGSLLMLSSDDYPPRFQRYWAFREGDHLALTVYLEANACCRKARLSTPTWTLEPIADYEAGIERYLRWVQSAYGLRPLASRPDTPDWVNDICLNITFHCHANHGRVNVTFSDIEPILERAAGRFDPANTQLHIVGWDGPWDMTWPAFRPGDELGGADGFRHMIDTAHRLGYRIGLHMNVMGFSYGHPQFEELKGFLQYQCRDSENRPLSWEHDLDGDDQDELIFAYISPDEPKWRAYLVERIVDFVAAYNTDIVHLDQSSGLINDRNYDHIRGVSALYRELRERLPSHVALSGEYVNEIVARLYPLCGFFPFRKPRLQRGMFAAFVRAFNYGMPPEPTEESLLYDAFERQQWTSDAFYEDLRLAEEAGLVPTLLVGKPDLNMDSDEVAAVFAAARRFRERLSTDDPRTGGSC